MATYDDIIEMLVRKRAELAEELVCLDAAIADLRGKGIKQPSNGSSVGVIPPIVDIVNYLKAKGGRARQSDIIHDVGDLREKRYPQLASHYANVYRALEYHVRRNRLIRCVDDQGQAAELKPLPERPRGPRKLLNIPELYEQDNWFQLKEEKPVGDFTLSLPRQAD